MRETIPSAEVSQWRHGMEIERERESLEERTDETESNNATGKRKEESKEIEKK
jgi:hypothetical protein